MEDIYADRKVEGINDYCTNVLSNSVDGWRFVAKDPPKSYLTWGEDAELRYSKFTILPFRADTYVEIDGYEYHYDSVGDAVHDMNGEKLGTLEEATTRLTQGED